MKNRELKLNEMPTTAELYALEQAARAARAQAMARLAEAALRRVKSMFSATGETKGLKHA
jgi:hypothetical protein